MEMDDDMRKLLDSKGHWKWAYPYKGTAHEILVASLYRTHYRYRGAGWTDLEDAIRFLWGHVDSVRW